MKINRITALELATKIANKKLGNRCGTLIKDLRLLLSHACNVSYDDIFFNKEESITLKSFVTFMHFLHKYLRSKPISKIIGYKYFYESKFFVTDHVLDPREDSETVIELALSIIAKDLTLSILDIGTGSGCLLVTLLLEFKQSEGLGIDISSQALKVAKRNAKNLLYNRNINFAKIDFLNNFDIPWKFDLIVSNPPYIKSSEIPNLDYNVRRYDPIIALDGCEDGLVFYRAIASKSGTLLKENGIIIVEIGYDQFDEVCEIFANSKLSLINYKEDNSGIKRSLAFKMNNVS